MKFSSLSQRSPWAPPSVRGPINACTLANGIFLRYKHAHCALPSIGKSPMRHIHHRQWTMTTLPPPRASSNASPTTTPTSTATTATDIQPQSIPAHWTDHLAHLRPGERRALNSKIPIVSRINALEPVMKQLTDEELAALTPLLRQRHSKQPLFSLLPEAFAAIREASSRVLGMRHYDVQLLGGIVLAEGQIAEMATGEGKTLVAALPAYLYALTGKGVHVVTVNDYLAQRDAAWIGKVLEFMGVGVGVVTGETGPEERKRGFAADVTYVTAYELAFTFLNDNLAPNRDAVCMRRPLHYAIVDEVDSILIDEARNPFIITTPDPSTDSTGTWHTAVAVARQLLPGEMDAESLETTRTDLSKYSGDFIPDYRTRIATLTPQGMAHAVRCLAELGQVAIAVDLQNSTSTTVYVVLFHDEGDSGRVDITVRKVSGDEEGPKGVVATRKDSAKDTYNNSDDEILTAHRLESRSLSHLASFLSNHLGLTLLALPLVTPHQWARAAPAALWADANRSWGRFLNQAIRAVHLYLKDVHYIVKDGEVVIVDTATGRERVRSRWQAGLHQALEAKEAMEAEDTREEDGYTDTKEMVNVRPEDYDRGRTTYQSLFNLYQRVAGMTGTAATEAEEFSEAYGLTVVRIPPHRPSRRKDHPPVVYLTSEGWRRRLRKLVAMAAAERRPVLLGTSSVEESEAVLDVVANVAFEARLQGGEVRRLEGALGVLPPALPPPLLPSLLIQDDDEEEEVVLSEEEGQYLEQYTVYMEAYEDAIRLLTRLVRSQRLTPDVAGATEFACNLLRGIADASTGSSTGSGREFSFLSRDEAAGAWEAVDVLSHVLSRSRLRNSVVINLLNARPERARKEAEIIAQAGLPGTITVATAMAGRGTDILLGGNPKGLTLIALQYLLLPVLAQEVPDVGDYRPQYPPLHGLDQGVAFLSEPDMNLHLPRPLVEVFRQAKAALVHVTNHCRSTTTTNNNDDDNLLPGYEYSTTTAQPASHYLSSLLESVEVDRSSYLLSHLRSSLTPSLESAIEWTMDEACTRWGDDVSPTERALRRYALLQWLWFDSQCERYAAQVRSVGGLATIITSIQDTRRTERQLRGRAGRQGDPGETFMVSHRGDPAVQTILSPAQLQGLWSMVEGVSDPDADIGGGLTQATLKMLTTTAEQQGVSGREQTRRYDAAMDGYRRHVFRLRRTVAGGGEGGRAVLAHRQLRTLGEDLVAGAMEDDGSRSALVVVVRSVLRMVQSLFRNDREWGDDEDDPNSDSNTTAMGRQEVEETRRLVEATLQGMEVGVSIRQEESMNTNMTVHFEVLMNVEAVSEMVCDALRTNQVLPSPVIISLDNNSKGDTPQEQSQSLGSLLLVQRRRVLFEIRRQNSNINTIMGRLQVWVADLIVLLYELKRSMIVSHLQQYRPFNDGSTMTTTTALHATSLLRIWERDVMLNALDALWTDFLQDAVVLQRAAMTRAFSQLDPVDEFRLEAAHVFARLLSDFKRQSAVGLLAPVDVGSVVMRGWEGGGDRMAAIEGSVRDTGWVLDAYMSAGEVEEEGVGTTLRSSSTASRDNKEVNVVVEDEQRTDRLATALGRVLERLAQASPEEVAAAQQTLQERRRQQTKLTSTDENE